MIDFDPNNPYHYHTSDGKKIVVSVDDWEKYKDQPYFQAVRKAVEEEQAAHPGPEYDVNQEDLAAWQRQVGAVGYNGLTQNYREMGRWLPDGYSFDPSGMIVGPDNTYYVQSGFKFNDRFRRKDGEPLRFSINTGTPTQRDLEFIPVDIDVRERMSEPVDMVRDINSEVEPLIDDYRKRNTRNKKDVTESFFVDLPVLQSPRNNRKLYIPSDGTKTTYSLVLTRKAVPSRKEAEKNIMLPLYTEGGPLDKKDDPILKDRKPMANFYQRLLDPNRKTIPDWEANAWELALPSALRQHNVATHKMSWATDNEGNAVVYPEIQEVDGKLIDFTRPPYDRWAGYENAMKTGDTIMMTPEQAQYWTENYKQFYPKFNEYSKGGSIHIDPSKRGTFTAAATKHNMGVQEFASKVLANKEDYPPAMVKKANFARNFGGHKKDEGGVIDSRMNEDAEYIKGFYDYYGIPLEDFMYEPGSVVDCRVISYPFKGSDGKRYKIYKNYVDFE